MKWNKFIRSKIKFFCSRKCRGLFYAYCMLAPPTSARDWLSKPKPRPQSPLKTWIIWNNGSRSNSSRYCWHLVRGPNIENCWRELFKKSLLYFFTFSMRIGILFSDGYCYCHPCWCSKFNWAWMLPLPASGCPMYPDLLVSFILFKVLLKFKSAKFLTRWKGNLST